MSEWVPEGPGTISHEVEEYLRGYSSYTPADNWRMDHNDGVTTLYLVAEGKEWGLSMDKGGLQDLLNAIEMVYWNK